MNRYISDGIGSFLIPAVRFRLNNLHSLCLVHNCRQSRHPDYQAHEPAYLWEVRSAWLGFYLMIGQENGKGSDMRAKACEEALRLAPRVMAMLEDLSKPSISRKKRQFGTLNCGAPPIRPVRSTGKEKVET